MICGYAEILKHSIIKDKKFFNWLEKNSKLILQKKKELAMQLKKVVKLKFTLLIKIQMKKV